jgi:hypothetical protein
MSPHVRFWLKAFLVTGTLFIVGVPAYIILSFTGVFGPWQVTDGPEPKHPDHRVYAKCPGKTALDYAENRFHAKLPDGVRDIRYCDDPGGFVGGDSTLWAEYKIEEARLPEVLAVAGLTPADLEPKHAAHPAWFPPLPEGDYDGASADRTIDGRPFDYAYEIAGRSTGTLTVYLKVFTD